MGVLSLSPTRGRGSLLLGFSSLSAVQFMPASWLPQVLKPIAFPMTLDLFDNCTPELQAELKVPPLHLCTSVRLPH